MLELRPNCEWCDKDLPPAAPDARICSYECTYCADCVETVLRNVCPTCSGGFAARPIRPEGAYRATHWTAKKLGLGHHPASTTRVHSQWTLDEVKALTGQLADVAPEDR